VVYEPALIRAMKSQLAAIGITVRVVPLRQTNTPEQSAAVLATADIARTGGNAGDASEAVAYLLHLPYLPATARAELHRIAASPFSRRDAAAAALAGKLERDAYYVGYADPATPELVSKRLGCVIDQPVYPGVDLAALCLRH
jgi:hypothetical protein